MMRQRLYSIWSDESTQRWKIPYLDVIAVGTIQFLLSLLVFGYGVYLMNFVLEDLYSLKTGLWTAIGFVATYKISSPWTKSYCKHLDNIRHKPHKRNVTITTITLAAELVTVSQLCTPLTQILMYGALGGALSAFIHVHTKFATEEAFTGRPKLFDTLDHIMKALSLVTMPHLVLFLSTQYDTNNSQLIIGSLVLNIIPACLIITTKKYQKLPLCKFQTVDKLSIEMVDLNAKSIVSSSDDEDDGDEEEEEGEFDLTSQPDRTGPPSNVQTYYQNVGVKILPNIPEEDEVEEDDLNEISSKRLSKISAILQELNENTKDITLSVTNLYQPDEIVEIAEPKEEIVDFVEESARDKLRCFSINSNVMFDLKMKKQRVKNFVKEHFILSFPRTLSKPCFYPAFISSGVTTTLSTIILATAPFMILRKNEDRSDPMTTIDATFLLTVMGFSWIFFLAGYPVFSKISSFKVRILFLIGLSISGISLFVAEQFSYDNSTLFSLMFGLGHGIVTYTENIAFEDFFGQEDWKKLQGALEISTGFVVILTYSIIYCSSLQISVLLRYAYWPYVAVVSLWTFAFILKRIIVYVKNIQRYNHERSPHLTDHKIHVASPFI